MIWTLTAALIFSVILTYNALRFLNYYQLESYQILFTNKTKDYCLKFIFLGCISIIFGYIAFVGIIFLNNVYTQLFLTSMTLLFLVLLAFNKSDRCTRQPLVFTKRIIRQIICLFCLIFAISVWLFYCGSLLKLNDCQLYYIFTPVLVFLLPSIVWLSCKIMLPIESLIRAIYIKSCQKKLADKKTLIKIGIVGSYAKTSVKNILTDILSVKYKTYCTPYNYNTPMGICKAVAKMPEDTQIFVAEMGARHVGDIKQLCKIVDIDIAVLTGINNQHLESFKSQDNIIKTKMEIAEFAKLKNIDIVYNCYDKICGHEFDDFNGKKLPNYDENFKYVSPCCDTKGSKFNLEINGNTLECNTVLLGEHNIQNIMMAVRVAKILGLDDQQIVQGIKNIKPISHRLELIRTHSNITIIDDSYNCNQSGAKIGIDCLNMFECRKVVATQGIVELGDMQAVANKDLGRYMADKIDVAILIGTNAPSIKQGLLAEDFPIQNLYTVKDLLMAQQLFKKVLKPDDVLYIQNDLTDNY